MKHGIPILATLLLLSALSGAAFGLQRFPPPQFESGHKLPETLYPPPHADLFEYLDVAALAAALGVASWLAMKKRSRTALFALMLASLAYFGFWRGGCTCPIGAIQNVTLALFDASYTIPLIALAFFLLPLVFTLFFGRTFCAAVCPLGAIQDAVLVRPVRVPPWLERGLRLLAYAYLGAAVLFAATGSAFIICQYDPFVGFFRLSGSLWMLLFGGAMLLIGLFIGRPYCRFLCPYGVILGWLSSASRWRVTITPERCVHCRLCEEACPFGAIRTPAEPPTARDRAQAKRRLAHFLGLIPVLVVAGLLVGGVLATPFSKMHARVSLAERVKAEETGKVKGTTDATDAFYETGQPPSELYAEALALRGKFLTGGRLLGGFLGLVVGLGLVQLSLRRSRPDYEADRSGCLACGRCFDYCPVELDRRKKARERKE